MTKKLLTIAVPTYNRAELLDKQLAWLAQAIQGFESECEIIISDNGPGIPDNKISTIFERFYTERPEGESYGNHSGLGLSISKQIVDAHGGSIWAENKKDADGNRIGAKFIVELQVV